MCRVAMELVVVLGSGIGNERSAFDTVIPQYHWRVRLAHVLPRSFLEETNVKFCTVRVLGTCFQSPQGGANLTEIGSHFLLDLGRVGITQTSLSGAPTSFAKAFKEWM